ncbi:MAG: hypothetical protein IPL28_07905 [Chloroflexi bacterium]|nr:hypothetical protein [Chloroflexota bacterium]
MPTASFSTPPSSASATATCKWGNKRPAAGHVSMSYSLKRSAPRNQFTVAASHSARRSAPIWSRPTACTKRCIDTVSPCRATSE